MKNFADFMARNKTALFEIARENTPRNNNGDAVISKEDSWFNEDEWDEYYKELTASDRNLSSRSVVR